MSEQSHTVSVEGVVLDQSQLASEPEEQLSDENEEPGGPQ